MSRSAFLGCGAVSDNGPMPEASRGPGHRALGAGTGGRHAAGAAGPGGTRHRHAGGGEAGNRQSWRLGEGSGRHCHDRCRRGRRGYCGRGDVIVEPTSGNTGVGLAVVAAQRGYRCIFVCTDKVAPEKVALLRAYGAEVVVCPAKVDPDDPRSYYSTAARLKAETPRAFSPDQVLQPEQPPRPLRNDRPRDLGIRPVGGSPTSWPAPAPVAPSAASGDS